jgi:hypothetical protein
MDQAAKMDRRAVTVGYYGSLVAYYGLALVVSFGLIRVFGAVAAVVLMIGMMGVTVWALMYEEDWWNDFRDRNRSILLGMAGNALTVGAGYWLAHL